MYREQLKMNKKAENKKLLVKYCRTVLAKTGELKQACFEHIYAAKLENILCDKCKNNGLDPLDFMDERDFVHNRPSLGKLNPLFRKHDKKEDDQILRNDLLKKMQKDGILKLSGMGLVNVPEKVYCLNETAKDVPPTLQFLAEEEEKDAWWHQVSLTELDLSNNSITAFSAEIKNLDTLKKLTLNDNALNKLPKEIAELKNLTYLNLQKNKLYDLPLELFTLPQLKHLDISKNEFEELDGAISDLHMLEVLDISNNKIKEIPSGIGFLVRLTSFLASHNKLKEVPQDLIDLRSLQNLDLSHNEMTVLPEKMGQLRQLKVLNAQYNNLMELPDFDGCNNLEELLLGKNRIEVFPNEFCVHLPHLKVLDLHDNLLTALPLDLNLLQSLTTLNISQNSIVKLPTALADLAHLISLKLDDNPIQSLRPDIVKCGLQRILRALREEESGRAYTARNPISAPKSPRSPSRSPCSARMPFEPTRNMLRGGGLNTLRKQTRNQDNEQGSGFPDKFKMRQTRCLNLSMQKLADIVDDNVFVDAYEECVNNVDLSKNQLSTLPAGLHHMRDTINELTATSNRLIEIPKFISQFTCIHMINISGNRLQDLPPEFGLLMTLRELNISNNRFINLPGCVYDLKHLELLNAGDNGIKSINATETGLASLKHLAYLNLSNNNIEQVPPILGNLKNITKLEISGNPFRQPRHQILAQGTDTIMAYLRDRIPNNN